jgi:hypothetical protein
MSLLAKSRVASRGILPRPAESISLILLSLAKRISSPGIPYKQEGTESNLKNYPQEIIVADFCKTGRFTCCKIYLSLLDSPACRILAAVLKDNFG